MQRKREACDGGEGCEDVTREAFRAENACAKASSDDGANNTILEDQLQPVIVQMLRTRDRKVHLRERRIIGPH